MCEQQQPQPIGSAYTLEHSGVAVVRMGPEPGENDELGETPTRQLRNQCLFMRTISLTLSGSEWIETFPEAISTVNQEGSQPEHGSQYLRPNSDTASNSANSVQGKRRSPGPSESERVIEEDKALLWSSDTANEPVSLSPGDDASSGDSTSSEEEDLKPHSNPSMEDEAEVLGNVGSLTFLYLLAKLICLLRCRTKIRG